MNDVKFKEFLNASQYDECVCYIWGGSEQFKEIVAEIVEDVKKFKCYTLTGKLEDILINVARDPKYATKNYSEFLAGVEHALTNLITDNIILLPINFLDISEFDNNISFCENMRLFLPTKDDIKKMPDFYLLDRQQKRRNDKRGKYEDNLCKYFKSVLGSKLNKEHILLAKDVNFFNYPILTINVKNVDYKVEQESGMIVEAAYSFLRMIDFKSKKDDLSWRILKNDWPQPAHTYCVYYSGKTSDGQTLPDGYYGHSFRFKFSEILDISTENFILNKDLFYNLLNTFINSCFLNTKNYSCKELQIINKWKNAIIKFNTAYESASLEKFDSAILELCATLESLFLKNTGKCKSELLKNALANFFQDEYDFDKIEKLKQTIDDVYRYRNKIIHEGFGYEYKSDSTRHLHDYQGIYRGMKPFEYNGTFHNYEDINNIKFAFEILIDILISSKTLDKINDLIKKST